MSSLVIAAGDSLLIARRGRTWSVEHHLRGMSPQAVAIDARRPERMYVGTSGDGLWLSRDTGRTWQPAGNGIPHRDITAVAVEPSLRSGPGVVYAGTEPSTLSRSEDGGDTWRELSSLLELPSSSSWSFPPKPETHHVRWIEADPNLVGCLFVAIEAGALVRSFDRGETWSDRARGSPIDTHTAATIPGRDGRLYCAAGDGYFESNDGGQTWRRPMEGIRHGYLVAVAVDPGDPETVVVSAAPGPFRAYRPVGAEAYLYRRVGGRFELLREGLPDPQGTVASRLATHPSEPGVFYAANNRGLFRSGDGGKSWQALPAPWSDGALNNGVSAAVAFSE